MVYMIDSLQQNMSYGLGTTARRIERGELLDCLMGLDDKGTVPFSVTQVTKQSSKKLKPPFEKFTLPGLANGDTWIAKVSQVTGLLGTDYESNVNTQRIAEGKTPDFKTSKTWGDRVTGNIVVHGDQTYLFYRVVSNRPITSPVYVVRENGAFRIADKSEIDQYLPAISSTNSQGLNESIQVRKISIDGIAAMKVSKHEYVLPLDKTRQAIFDLVNPPG